jgi:hypothetical protein
VTIVLKSGSLSLLEPSGPVKAFAYFLKKRYEKAQNSSSPEVRYATGTLLNGTLI